ncbi:MAG: pyruvate formate-lyase-activating protein [Armatimonadia bacterium]
MNAQIHSIETLGALDGPGLRTVVFFSGCPLRCAYCHNPDTWAAQGTEMTADDIIARVQRSRPYFGRDGGVTLSGGEPLAQPQFVAELLRRCQDVGIHTAVDTSGACLNDAVKEALQHADLVILDLKHTDPAQYHALTGGSLEQPLAFLDYVRQQRIPLWVRQVIVPGLNDTEEQVLALAALLRDVPSLQRVELLPYHTMGLEKWQELGLRSPLEDPPPTDPQKVKRLEQVVLEAIGMPCEGHLGVTV